ncbi:MAG TPA: hypothetical protein VD905_08045 [Flavobacteriales bacterium]|nr:hypothetical protein [Flavobacteriales bacterium]
MPSQIRDLVLDLTRTSLFIEFFAISADIIRTKEIRVNDLKIKEFTSFSTSINYEYSTNVDFLISLAKKDMADEEHNMWGAFGISGLAKAYGGDEPDYDRMIFKEPNPGYEK